MNKQPDCQKCDMPYTSQSLLTSVMLHHVLFVLWCFWCFLCCQPEQAAEQTAGLPGDVTCHTRHRAYSLQFHHVLFIFQIIPGTIDKMHILYVFCASAVSTTIEIADGLAHYRQVSNIRRTLVGN